MSLKNIIKRLYISEEKQEFEKMIAIAESITEDSKSRLLLAALEKLFPLLKRLGAKQKAVIFTESLETQKISLWCAQG